MGAQRKLVDPVVTASPVAGEPAFTPAERDATRRSDGDLPTSPAIVLQEQLAARLAENATGPAVAVTVAAAPEFKLPMALRIVTIVALSLALWGGVVLTAVAVLT